ncbi:MAG: HNH endonuclease [Aestuariivita sp.]|nr:HNH endonuclease [Aestuariivita sp.]
MLSQKQDIVRSEIAQGTGADIDLEVDRTGIQTSLKIWFADLQRTRSPIVELLPTGLRRIRAMLTFGNFAAPTIRQMMQADEEEVKLARALITSVSQNADVKIDEDQSLDDWTISEKGISIQAEKSGLEDRFDDDNLISICHELVTPILGAMAELYGYDSTVPPSEVDGMGAKLEGAVTMAVVRRRERNPRNRLLCIQLHGEICQICGMDARAKYGDAGGIIEVHHLQPLSQTDQPRAYDPQSDLIPVCPSCHRAVHTRKPVPWTPDEIKARLTANG